MTVPGKTKRKPNFKKFIISHEILSSVAVAAERANAEVYVVGGYVRDLIIQRTARTDIDFLVVGDGTEFAQHCAKAFGVKDITIFRSFGTAHFRYGSYDLEFVGARKESYSRESRNPVVVPGTFKDDIKRRDFTINALAISLSKKNLGKLYDVFNGYQDILDKKIITPLDPRETFNDDPLRIIRAFRFASQLDFEVSEEVLQAASEMKQRLEIISRERITTEFFKILESNHPSKGLILLYESGVMAVIFPEVANLGGIEQRKDYHHKDVFYHTCEVIDNISKLTNNVWLRFAALVHDIAKPHTKKFVENIGWTFHGHEELGAALMKGIFRRQKLPMHKLEYVRKLVRLHLRPQALAKEEVTDSAVRRLIVEAGEDLNDLMTLCRADITSKNSAKVKRFISNYDYLERRVHEIREKDRLEAFQSPVRGNEIMSICGIPPSPIVGKIKSAIEEAILEGRIPNTYEAALAYLMEIKDKFIQ